MQKITIALPKGRILEEVMPILLKAGITPEDDFNNESSRKLQFSTNHKNIDLIRVRSFDVATFVAFGAAQIGICGNDVLMEFDYEGLYAPLDLGIGKCRIAVASTKDIAENDYKNLSHIRVATKYPEITKNYFAKKGIQAECIKLSGAMELAPKIGLCKIIVDLVSSGATLKANDLVEKEDIAVITSKLIVNRSAFKTDFDGINKLIENFRQAIL